MINRFLAAAGRIRQASTPGRLGLRRLLTCIMILLLLFMVLGWGKRIYSGYAQELQARIELQESKYQKLRSLLAEVGLHRQEHQALSKFEADGLEPGMIQASSLTLAEAEFQNLVRDMAQEAGLSISSLSLLPREQLQGVHVLRLEISGQGGIKSLEGLLQGICEQKKFIFLREILINSPDAAGDRDLNLDCELVAWVGQ